MEGPGWAALILLITFALMIVGAISGWDMDAGNAFIAALVLIGTVWVTWAAFEWSRDLLRRRSKSYRRAQARYDALRRTPGALEAAIRAAAAAGEPETRIAKDYDLGVELVRKVLGQR